MRREWLVAAAPALAGLIAAGLLSWLLRPIPIAFLRVDLATLFLLLGLAAGLMAALLTGLNRRMEKQTTELLDEAHTEAAGERRRFLRRLDHELKNPLTAIRAGLANLSEAPSETARQEAFSSVEAQALRLSRLAADLRKLAELETRTLERSPVDLKLILEEACHLAQDQAEEGQRQLTLTVPRAPWPLPNISGDPDLLLLALHNLLDNALKFTRPGDTVEVRAFEDGSGVIVEVADTGPGIPEEDISHVWEELYRSRSASGTPGSGLGLALVRAIAERHNGQVMLRSRTGQGTVVSVRLPLG
jgi:two-component system, OmpR family, sensor kinase